MENCLSDGKELCVYELKNHQGLYDNDLVISWKELAHERKLICPECGAKVRLAAGQIVEPYFAHYDKKECSYGNVIESEESRKAKRLLYMLLKESFPEAKIHARYKLLNGLYASVYAALPNASDIAIEFRRQNLSVEQFRIREAYYKEHNIRSIFVLPIDLDKDKRQLSWYQELIHKSMNFAVFLNVFKETLLLKKSFEYVINGSRSIEIFSKEYKIQDLTLNMDGTFRCDFDKQCDSFQYNLEERIENQERELREEKIRRQEEQMRLKIAKESQQKALRESVEREAIRYAKYREQIHQKELLNNSLKMKQQLKEKQLNQELPDWVRMDVLESAVNYMREGKAYLVSEKYRQLIKDLGLL